MILYHATTEENADAILRQSFKDGSGILLEGLENGVWFADRPMPYGVTTLCIEVPDAILPDHELIYDDPLDYREFLFPAIVVNRFRVVDVSTVYHR